MTDRNGQELWSLLLTRAAELTGAPKSSLVDDDGDVHLADSPFGAWGRLQRRDSSGELEVVLLAVPLTGLTVLAGLREAVEGAIDDPEVVLRLADGSIHLFWPHPPEVLDRPEDFRAALDRLMAIGKRVVAAVQPALGGLTTEQTRLLEGWRGVNRDVEADLAATAGDGITVLAHGWDPRRESPPLLCFEDRAGGAWERRFVTVEKDGGLRLRSTVPVARESRRGFELTVRRFAPEAARTWAGRLGVPPRAGKLEVEEVAALAGRPWRELWEAAEGLASEGGVAWEGV
jgi:hypothetical protein